jgi:energy-coupling factor transporter ATP-binding protein EcfA2
MEKRKPKEQHEQLLANADKELIVQHLSNGQDQKITIIAVTLARQCNLFVHFERLWKMRVADLDEKLSTERYTRDIYVNRKALYKTLIKDPTD